MNWPDEKLSTSEARLAYRRAVVGVMTRFMRKDETEAKRLVAAWWKRMQGTEVFSTSIFLHDEPINTACDLAHAERTPAIHELGEAYFEVLASAMPKRSRRQRPVPVPVSHRTTDAA